MSLGPTELIFVGVIILVLVLMSKGKKARERKRQEAEREAEALPAAKLAKGIIRYPELQLLGIVVLLAGIAMAGIGYLMTSGILDTLSLAGILVVFLGLAFIVLARQRTKPASESLKNPGEPVNGAGIPKTQPQPKITNNPSAIEPRIKPEDLADFKKYMALKAKAAEKP